MTKQELIKELKKLQTRKINIFGVETLDKEENHIMADSLLLKYIDDEEVTNAFKKINKWYA